MPNSFTKEERYAALTTLLAQGAYNWQEILDILPEYEDITRRSLERDITNLAEKGLEIIAERSVGSRYISLRLKDAPPRPAPIKEKIKPIKKLDFSQSLAELADDEMLDSVSAAKLLGISKRRVTFLCAEKRINHQRVGETQKIVILGKDLKAFAAQPRKSGRTRKNLVKE